MESLLSTNFPSNIITTQMSVMIMSEGESMVNNKEHRHLTQHNTGPKPPNWQREWFASQTLRKGCWCWWWWWWWTWMTIDYRWVRDDVDAMWGGTQLQGHRRWWWWWWWDDHEEVESPHKEKISLGVLSSSLFIYVHKVTTFAISHFCDFFTFAISHFCGQK